MAIGSYQGMWAEWSTERSGHIPFQCNSVFLNIAPLAQYAQRRSLNPKCPFGNLLIRESVE